MLKSQFSRCAYTLLSFSSPATMNDSWSEEKNPSEEDNGNSEDISARLNERTERTKKYGINKEIRNKQYVFFCSFGSFGSSLHLFADELEQFYATYMCVLCEHKHLLEQFQCFCFVVFCYGYQLAQMVLEVTRALQDFDKLRTRNLTSKEDEFMFLILQLAMFSKPMAKSIARSPFLMYYLGIHISRVHSQTSIFHAVSL